MKKIYIIGTPEHTNSGDHAILIAQKNLLKKYVEGNKEIIEVSSYAFKKEFPKLKQEIKDDDLITIIGGGNMGNEYLFEEDARQTMIREFPNNMIISFPQSIYFKKGTKKEEFDKFIEVYSNHKNLHVFARDEVSFEKLKELLPTGKIYLVPDVVLSMEPVASKEKKGVILCVRSDVEGILSKNDKEKILKLAKEISTQIVYLDTVDSRCNVENREEFIDYILSEFSKAELIITDRLHGMVLSTLSQTPCVAIKNYNHKITSLYNWIKDEKYVEVVTSVDEIEEKINMVMKDKNPKLSSEKLLKKFSPLIELLKSVK